MTEFNRKQYYRRKSQIIKKRRKIAYTKKRIRRFRMLLRVALIFGLLYFCWWVLNLKMWYLNPDDILNFNPNVIKIEGNVITPEDKIVEIIRNTEPPDEQIFKYSTKNLEASIEELKSINKVYVRRFWFPARIIVFIEERIPVFLIAPNKETAPIAAITKDGHCIGREFMPIPSKFKTTKILSYGTGEDNYENWDKKRVDEISRLIKTIETYSKEKVVYVDLRNKKDIYIQLEDVMLRLGVIDETVNERIQWIPTILPEAKAIKHRIKYIDLRWKDTRYIKYENKTNAKKETDVKQSAQEEIEP